MNIRLNDADPVRAGRYPAFTSKEKNCIHVGCNKNGSYVRQYRVDGGVVPKSYEGARCDYLLLNDDRKRAYYIELKGSDIRKAMQQIDVSVAMLQPDHPGYTVYRRIVYCSGSHEVQSSEVLRWKAKHGPKLVKIKSRRMEEDI